MNYKSGFTWVVAWMLFLPAQAESQQDPAQIAAGAQIYANTCSRCHNARSGSERTDAEWVTIVGHMRARANMSKSSAAAVLAFLQATNVPEAGFPPASTPELEVVPRTRGPAFPPQRLPIKRVGGGR